MCYTRHSPNNPHPTLQFEAAITHSFDFSTEIVRWIRCIICFSVVMIHILCQLKESSYLKKKWNNTTSKNLYKFLRLGWLFWDVGVDGFYSSATILDLLNKKVFEIQWGIFQGDTFLPSLFVIVMVPLITYLGMLRRLQIQKIPIKD